MHVVEVNVSKLGLCRVGLRGALETVHGSLALCNTFCINGNHGGERKPPLVRSAVASAIGDLKQSIF